MGYGLALLRFNPKSLCQFATLMNQPEPERLHLLKVCEHEHFEAGEVIMLLKSFRNSQYRADAVCAIQLQTVAVPCHELNTLLQAMSFTTWPQAFSCFRNPECTLLEVALMPFSAGIPVVTRAFGDYAATFRATTA